MARFKARRTSNLYLIAALVLVAIVGLLLRNRSIGDSLTPSQGAATAPAPEAEAVAPRVPPAGGGRIAQPSMTDQQDLAGRAWKVVIYLGVILATILLVARGIKRYGGGRFAGATSSEISVLGRHYISPKQSLAMVKVRQKELLLGITDQSIHLIYDFTPEEEDRNGTEFAESSVEV